MTNFLKNQQRGTALSVSGLTADEVAHWLNDKTENENMSQATAKQIQQGFAEQELLG